MNRSAKRAGRGLAVLLAGTVVMSTLSAPADAATTWNVIWLPESYYTAYGYAYKGKNCTGGRVKLNLSDSMASKVLSIRSPMYTWVSYDSPSTSFDLEYNTCWNLRGADKYIIWQGYNPAR